MYPIEIMEIINIIITIHVTIILYIESDLFLCSIFDLVLGISIILTSASNLTVFLTSIGLKFFLFDQKNMNSICISNNLMFVFLVRKTILQTVFDQKSINSIFITNLISWSRVCRKC